MWEDWLTFIIALVICVGIAFALALAVTAIVRMSVRKHEWPGELTKRARRPFRALMVLLGLWVAVEGFLPAGDTTMPVLRQGIGIVAIGVTAWLLIALDLFATDMMLGRFRVDVPDNRQARRIRTQTLILRRLTVALIVTVAIASILLTFPAVQTIGASILASAGIASIVAGLAAQSTLANMFAGIQLVFSDALRVDDVVVAGGEWGRVGEITLSYVVLDVWDQRRLVLPCTYFTTQPFENWTRRGSEILGAVELDLDWRTPVDRVRDRVAEILSETELWDGRTSVVQVTESTGGLVRVRVLISAADAGKLFDLRCLVREELVDFVRRTAPESLPTQRVLVGGPEPEEVDAQEHRRPTEGMFSGSADADERHREFTQAVPVVDKEDTAGQSTIG